MKNSNFKLLINEIPSLGTAQFRILRENIDKRIKSKKVSNILETPFQNLLCPHCKSKIFIKWGKRNDMQRYKCKVCKKTFNSLTKTPLARLRRKGHWLDYAECLKEGLTIRKAAIYCGIHKNTSFRWRHRFITNFKYIKAKMLSGIVETGELMFKESFKGTKNIDLIKKEKRDVFVIYNIDRNNNIYDITDKGFTEFSFKELSGKIDSDSLMMLNKKFPYKSFFDTNKIKNILVKENKKQLVKIDRLNDFRNRFYKWIMLYFKGVATKYLENYVSWFRCLNEFNSGIKPLTILYRAKSIEKYRHQPLKVTTLLL